jgi:nitrile hydratase subunit beta
MLNFRKREKRMVTSASKAAQSRSGIRLAQGEEPIFKKGDAVRILTRTPVGHYRVPTYVRGKHGVIEAVIEPAGIDNEEEGFGRNAGSKLHYYRVAIPMTEVWDNYQGPAHDSMRIEVFETWLEGVKQ